MIREALARIVACLGVALTCSLLTCGCSNAPDSLSLALAPVKGSFQYGEPVRLTATLSASEGTVCIQKPSSTAPEVELRRDESDVLLTRSKVMRCGNPYIPLLPLYPVFYAGCHLDVADVAGRFVVVSPDENHEFSFTVLGAEWGYVMFEDHDPDYALRQRSAPPLPPGRYVMSMTLRPDRFQNAFPPPLLWGVYPQPVRGETSFVVADIPTVPRVNSGGSD